MNTESDNMQFPFAKGALEGLDNSIPQDWNREQVDAMLAAGRSRATYSPQAAPILSLLRKLAAIGPIALHDGPVARAIVAKVQQHPVRPGTLSLDDLKRYQPREREALCFDHTAAAKALKLLARRRNGAGDRFAPRGPKVIGAGNFKPHNAGGHAAPKRTGAKVLKITRG